MGAQVFTEVVVRRARILRGAFVFANIPIRALPHFLLRSDLDLEHEQNFYRGVLFGSGFGPETVVCSQP